MKPHKNILVGELGGFANVLCDADTHAILIHNLPKAGKSVDVWALTKRCYMLNHVNADNRSTILSTKVLYILDAISVLH